MTKVLVALLSLSLLAFADDVVLPGESRPPITQSHPGWWMYASPDATALVGIQWSYLRSSPLAGAVTSELSADGSLGLPDFDFLQGSQQILIASPELMVLAYGSFPAGSVKAMAAAKGLKASAYKGIELWVSPEKDTMSVARVSDQLILFAHVPTIKNAIDRNTAPMSRRNYSPLLSQAARYAKQDLWVVATRLPDPLASLFVPFDVQARWFEGSLSVWDGLHATAALETASVPAAEQTADAMWDAIDQLPTMADATQIATDGSTVLLTVDMDEKQFQSSLRRPEAPVAVAAAPQAAKAQPAAAANIAAKPAKPPTAVATPVAKAASKAGDSKASSATSASVATSSGQAPPKELPTKQMPSTTAANSPAKPVPGTPAPTERPVEPPAPAHPLVIHIIGLSDGPREVILPQNHP